jgi:hypothetical protein
MPRYLQNTIFEPLKNGPICQKGDFFSTPFYNLPPLIQNALSRDADEYWINDLIMQGLNWFNHFSGFMGRLIVLLNNIMQFLQDWVSILIMGAQFII